MEVFFLLTTIVIFFFVRLLQFASNKLPFGLLHLRDSSEADLDQVIIRDGRVIYPGDPDHPLPFGRNEHDVSIDNQTVESPSSLSVQDEKTADAPPSTFKDKESEKDIDIKSKKQDSEPSFGQKTEDEPDEPQKKGAKRGRLPKIERFWDYLEVSGHGKRTIVEYKYEWKWWNEQALNKKRTVYTLRMRDIEEILKGIKPATTRRKIAFLRTLSKWYLREDRPRLYEETGKIKAPKLPKSLPKDKGTEDFERLREKAKKLIDEKDRRGLWIALKLICGLRISEIQTAKASGKGMVQVMGKGHKERLVPAPIWIIKGMKKIPADGKGGWRKDRKLIWYHLAKIDLKNPHSLRHTCASELLRRDMKIEEIKEFLGHENIATTNIYARSVVPTRAAELLDS